MTTITLIGRLGQDVDLKFTQAGKAVASLSVADSHRKKDGDQWVDDGTTWYRVTAWEYLAEQCAELRKGQRVIVVGELRNREYEHNGEKRRSLEIRAYEIGPALDKYPPKDARPPQSRPADDPWGGAGDDGNPPF